VNVLKLNLSLDAPRLSPPGPNEHDRIITRGYN
jgi:hypothetical protein